MLPALCKKKVFNVNFRSPSLDWLNLDWLRWNWTLQQVTKTTKELLLLHPWQTLKKLVQDTRRSWLVQQKTCTCFFARAFSCTTILHKINKCLYKESELRHLLFAYHRLTKLQNKAHCLQVGPSVTSWMLQGLQLSLIQAAPTLAYDRHYCKHQCMTHDQLNVG